MSQQRNTNAPRVSLPNIRGGVIGMFILIVILGIAASTMFKFAQIDEGQRGIIITQGAVCLLYTSRCV